jgi:glycosyltransferase involved in cell wall biosynthesis
MKITVTGLRGFPNIQGGVETHCEELFPRLAKSGCDITVLRRKPYVHENPLLTSWQGVRFKDISTTKKMGFEAIIHTIRGVWYAYRTRADILHIHAIGPAVTVPLAKLLGLKVIVTHHGPDYNRLKWGWFAQFVIKLGERFTAKWADEIIVISTVIQQDMHKKYNRKDTHLIYNGVNLPHPIETTDYIEKLGLSAGKYILTVGRFVEEKNFDKLILAYASTQLPAGYKVVIAGDADHPSAYSESLKNLATKHGIILTGMIKGAPLQELYTHAGLFVLPSSHEGLPITLLEAMSYGIDTLVSDIPANKAVNLPQDCYFHYSDNIVPSLRQALEAKLLNPAKHSYDLTPYNWDTIAEQTMEVYEQTALQGRK